MSDIKEITEALIKFRNERDWDQFHNPKDLAVALNIEAGELLENFLWKSHEEADKAKVKEELETKTGLKVTGINVNIQGVHIEEKK